MVPMIQIVQHIIGDGHVQRFTQERRPEGLNYVEHALNGPNASENRAAAREALERGEWEIAARIFGCSDEEAECFKSPMWDEYRNAILRAALLAFTATPDDMALHFVPTLPDQGGIGFKLGANGCDVLLAGPAVDVETDHPVGVVPM